MEKDEAPRPKGRRSITPRRESTKTGEEPIGNHVAKDTNMAGESSRIQKQEKEAHRGRPLGKLERRPDQDLRRVGGRKQKAELKRWIAHVKKEMVSEEDNIINTSIFGGAE